MNQDDEISRQKRAAEQGFVLPAYHGSTAGDITSFEARRPALGSAGVYASTDPAHANVFAHPPIPKDPNTPIPSAGGAIYPLLIRGKIAPREYVNSLYDKYGDHDKVEKEVKNQGFSGFYEDRQHHGLVVFDPKNVRSRFAQFNPQRTEDSELLAKKGGMIKRASGGISVDPAKAARAGLMAAKQVASAVPLQSIGNGIKAANAIGMMNRTHLDTGGSLRSAMDAFAQQRDAALTGKNKTNSPDDQLLRSLLWQQQHHLVTAEPEQSRQQPVVQQMGDLGSELDRGAKFLMGKYDDDTAPAKGGPSPTNRALENPTTTSIAPQLGKSGQFRPQYALSAPDISPAVINTIAGEASTRDQAATDAVINNMFNRLGSKGYGPSDNLYEIARSQGVNGRTPQYTGYRQASPEEAQFIRGRIQAIASGALPDNTNGSMEYRGAWLYDKAAKMHPEGVGVGGNWFFPTSVQPGPYAARQPDVEEAGADTGRSDRVPVQEAPRAMGTGTGAVVQGDDTARTSTGQPVRTDANGYALPLNQQAPNYTPPSPTPQAAPPAPQANDASAGPQAQAEPMSNLYNRIAFAPDVQAGYDNPQLLFGGAQAPSAAKGGRIESTPTNELIARALKVINRRKRDTGGPTLQSLQAQQAKDETAQRTVNNALGLQAEQQLADESSYGGRGGTMPYSGAGLMFSAINNSDAGLGNQQAPAQPVPPATPNTPATQGQPVGNQGTPTGQGIETGPTSGPSSYQPPGSPGTTSTGPTTGIPFALPTGTNGYSYNNSLDQVLGTNNPTMNQIFGYNYPVPPPPQPQPVGPISQNNINAMYGLFGYGGGGYRDGGAIIMNALNRARKAKGNKLK